MPPPIMEAPPNMLPSMLIASAFVGEKAAKETARRAAVLIDNFIVQNLSVISLLNTVYT